MTTEPISLTQAMMHLRIEEDDRDFNLLPLKITAARRLAEQYLNRSIVAQERVETLNHFPAYAITLPNGPVQSITEIAYIDDTGAPAIMPSGDYHLSGDTLTPAYGESWPTTRAQMGAVTITYQAGMMNSIAPSVLTEVDISAAILLYLGDLWENREAQVIGAVVTINKTAERLLDPYRIDMGI